MTSSTMQISQQKNSHGIPKLKKDAKDGGAVAGRTRKDIEQQIGTKVVSKENFLSNKQSKMVSKPVKDKEKV
jgi:DNA-damage-inducible protein D